MNDIKAIVDVFSWKQYFSRNYAIVVVVVVIITLDFHAFLNFFMNKNVWNDQKMSLIEQKCSVEEQHFRFSTYFQFFLPFFILNEKKLLRKSIPNAIFYWFIVLLLKLIVYFFSRIRASHKSTLSCQRLCQSVQQRYGIHHTWTITWLVWLLHWFQHHNFTS